MNRFIDVLLDPLTVLCCSEPLVVSKSSTYGNQSSNVRTHLNQLGFGFLSRILAFFSYSKVLRSPHVVDLICDLIAL